VRAASQVFTSVAWRAITCGSTSAPARQLTRNRVSLESLWRLETKLSVRSRYSHCNPCWSFSKLWAAAPCRTSGPCARLRLAVEALQGELSKKKANRPNRAQSPHQATFHVFLKLGSRRASTQLHITPSRAQGGDERVPYQHQRACRGRARPEIWRPTTT